MRSFPPAVPRCGSGQETRAEAGAKRRARARAAPRAPRERRAQWSSAPTCAPRRSGWRSSRGGADEGLDLAQHRFGLRPDPPVRQVEDSLGSEDRFPALDVPAVVAALQDSRHQALPLEHVFADAVPLAPTRHHAQVRQRPFDRVTDEEEDPQLGVDRMRPPDAFGRQHRVGGGDLAGDPARRLGGGRRPRRTRRPSSGRPAAARGSTCGTRASATAPSPASRRRVPAQARWLAM